MSFWWTFCLFFALSAQQRTASGYVYPPVTVLRLGPLDPGLKTEVEEGQPEYQEGSQQKDDFLPGSAPPGHVYEMAEQTRGKRCADDFDCMRVLGQVCKKNKRGSAGTCQCPPSTPVRIAEHGQLRCVSARLIFEDCTDTAECSYLNPYVECINEVCTCGPPNILKRKDLCIPATTSTVLPNLILSLSVTLMSIGALLGITAFAKRQTQRGQNITQILDTFFTRGYDKRVRPNYGGLPVEVGVTMQIISISTVSEVQMDFTSDFYFRQSWRDERLSFQKVTGLDSMTVGAEVAEKIWVPDTFFANEKSAYFHMATTPNTFLRINAGGEVFRSIRLTVTASCPMDLRYFPMDRQACTIEIESFGYTMKDIRYRWSEGDTSVRIAKEVELPQFKVLGHVQKAKEVALTTGNYSRLVCEIRFARSMGYYLIQIYIPAGLIVVISWVSFWLHRNASPARVALGVTTVLTMTTLMSSTNAALPKISYVKSIDVYLGTCFVMVFTALLEYATVGYLGKRITMRKTRCQQLAKLAEQHRQRCAAASANEPSTEPLLASPEVSIVKTVGSCQVCPAAVASQGQQREAPPPGFTMVRRGGECCPGLPGSCQVCPAAVASQAQQQAAPPGIPMQEVRLKMVDPKGFSKSSTLENTVNGAPDIEAAFCKNPNKLFGVSPSDIDKYSRVVFPVCFVCFNLMYWIIYLHISDVLPDDVNEE